jgi:hypothetical protein
MSDEGHRDKSANLRRSPRIRIYSEEIMNSAPTTIMEEKKSVGITLPITESEQLPLTEAPEISRGAWKVIIFLLVGGVLFLASVGAYVFSGLHRFQNCL